MLTEQNIPRFPDDFPDTNAYLHYASQVNAELQEQYNRKPPAKRPNYAKLKVETPFMIPWNSVAKYAPSMGTLNDDIPPYFVIRGEENLPYFDLPRPRDVKYDATLRWVPKQSTSQHLPNLDPRSNILPWFGVSLVRVSIKALRGQVHKYAMICTPSEEDQKLWKNNPKVYKPPVESTSVRTRWDLTHGK